MRRIFFALVVCGCAGCENSSPASPGTVTRVAPAATPPEPQPPKFAPKFDPNAKPVPATAAPEVEMERVPARPGVSGKGNYDPGIFTTPLSANFSLHQQLIFDSIIPNALKTFEAARNRKPSSHQEFMTEIIGQSNIRLPSLPPQHRYIYDVELGEFMVERPKKAD